jgi:hypothetical protein
LDGNETAPQKPTTTRSQPAESTESTSTDTSIEHDNLMELGEAILRELELERSNDILGRWLAHHIAELMHAAKEEQSAGTATHSNQAAGACREAILQLWQHRSHWPTGWPPARALQMARLLERLDGEEPYAPWRDQNLLTALQTTHHRLLSALVDCVAVGEDDTVETKWLQRFPGRLTVDEVVLLTRAVETSTRLSQLVLLTEGEPETDSDGDDHPVLKLADTYRGLVADALAPRTPPDDA